MTTTAHTTVKETMRPEWIDSAAIRKRVLSFLISVVCALDLSGANDPEGEAVPDDSTVPVSTLTAASTGSQSDEDGSRREIFTYGTVLPEGVLFGAFTKIDGPYLICGNVIVPSNEVLEFGPACTVYVGGEYTTITVFGQLIARGTAEQPVVFMSAKRKPQPWDWDRIYCRSRIRSLFEHCHIRHSNYGICVENGSVDILNCSFEHNSLHGIVLRNSECTIASTRFTGNHVLAVNLLEGSDVRAESLSVSGNISGIACGAGAKLICTGGSISSNVNGVIVDGDASVELVATEVARNRNGILSRTEIHGKNRETVYANGRDMKTIGNAEMDGLLHEPEPVSSTMFPSAAPVAALSGFKAGFSALNAPREPSASFIGNLTTGFTWHGPRSSYHPIDRDTLILENHRDDGTTDTGFSVERIMRRQTKYPGEQSDKWYAGFQPELQFFANGKRGEADINLLMDLYGNQWLSTTRYLGKNMFNLTMNYARQTLVFGDFFESGSEISLPGRQMTGVRYSGKHFEMGRGEKRLDFKIIAAETEIAKDSGDHEIFIYNQTVDTGMSQRQQITYLAELNVKPNLNSSIGVRGIIARDQTERPLFRKAITDPAAPDPVSSQTGCIMGSLFFLDRKVELYGEVDLGSADTLSGSDADMIAWYNPQFDRALPELFSLFRRDRVTEHYAVLAGMRSELRDYSAHLKYLRIAPSYFSAGDPYMVNWRRNFSLTLTKPVLPGMELSGVYEFDRSTLPGLGGNSPPTVTDLNTFSVVSTWEPGGSRPSFSIDYTLQHNSENRRESVTWDDTTYSESYDDVEFTNRISMEGRQTFDNGVSYSVRYQLFHDNDFSDHPDSRFDDEGDRLHTALSGRISLKFNQRLRNRAGFKIAFKHENRDSLRAYQYHLTDQFSWQAIPRKLNFTLSGEYSFRNEKEYFEKWLAPASTIFYHAELEARYSFTSRISLSARGGYEKSYDEITGSTENYSAPSAGAHLTYLF